MDASTQALDAIGFHITAEDMAAFRRLGGDAGSAACSADRSIVYGGLIVAQIPRLLATHFPGRRLVWRSLALTFLSSLHVGERASLRAITIHADDDRGLIDLKLALAVGARVIAEGEAAALVMHAPGTCEPRPSDTHGAPPSC